MSSRSLALRPKSAIERASSSAVPMLEPNSTVSFVPWLLAAFFGAAFLGAGRAATLTPDPRTTSGLQLHAHHQAFGLDGERFLDLELIARVVDQAEALQDQAQHQGRLGHGELPADAGALAVAERLVGVRRHLGLAVGREVLGIEHFGARSPNGLVAMQHRRQHGDEGAFAQLVFPADRLVLIGVESEGRRGRPQPQRLLQDLADIDELVDLLRRGLGVDVAAQHAVDFLVGLLDHVRIVQQEVDRERQHPARGLMARDQEGVHLVADVDVVQPLAAVAVDAAQHVAEKVGLGRSLSVRPAPRGARG